MRRHSTKQPSGPAAAPKSPAPSAARMRKSSMRAVSVIVAVPMAVIVAMGVKRERVGHARPEQLREGGIAHDLLGLAFAADVAVEADDAVGLRHHDMQVVAHQ